MNFDVMAQMAHRMRNATLVQVKNSTHVVPVDNPDGLVEELLRSCRWCLPIDMRASAVPHPNLT